jgi:hypothetical protein
LIPDWQFNGSETSWTYHTGGLSTDLRLESVEWTDGRLVRVATCTEKHHTDCYPSWRMSELIPVNPSLAYEFSIYIKSTVRSNQWFYQSSVDVFVTRAETLITILDIMPMTQTNS